MKKIYTFLVFSLLLFVGGCNQREENDESVEILVNSDLKIEIDSIEDFKWNRVITIKINGEFQPYSGTTVSLKPGEEIKVDDEVWFIASYEYNGKTYTEEFSVNIYKWVETYTISLMFLNGEEKKYNITENEEFNINDVKTDTYGIGFEFKGWYKDPLFENEFNESIIKENIRLYGKWNKVESFSEVVLSKDERKDIMDSYINDLLTSTDSYIPSWNKEGFKGRWNYIDGVFLNSIANLYEQTNDNKYRDFLIKYINFYIDEKGNFINPKDLSSGYKGGELDSICASRILFDAYAYTNDSRYLYAIEYTFNELNNIPITANGYSYSHKSSYLNQIWLDGMYMYVPYLARYALYKNDLSMFDDITRQYKYIRDNMYDEEKGLYYHGHDTTKSIFWANKNTGNSKSFWLRSMGWYIVSIVDVLEFFPDGENKEYMISLLKEAVNGIMKYQEVNSKMFYQVVDKEATYYLISSSYLAKLKNNTYIYQGNYTDISICNYLESSGSSMIAYTLLKGARLGYLDSSYSDKGQEIFEGIWSHSFKNGNYLNDICITAGLGPESNTIRDGSIYYYLAEPVGSNDAKGVGPFIMAYLEYVR